MNNISVVIPTYNHAKSLSRTLESILNQTIEPLEIIIIDDGSTDDTKEVLKKFLNKIQYYYQENKGANFARNTGLKKAKGDFVICLDADVELYEDSLDKMRKALLADENASFAYGGFYFGWKYFRPIPFSAKNLKKMNYIHTSALVRMKDHPGFDEKIKRFQDWDLWLTMVEQGKYGIMINDILFKVYIDGESRIGSSWLPSFVYKLPWPVFGYTPKKVLKYQENKRIIRQKHSI